MAIGIYFAGTAELKYNTNTDFVKIRIDTEISKFLSRIEQCTSWKLHRNTKYCSTMQ
jgi:hypothetical protein